MPTIEELQDELSTLRTAHNEVLQKNRERKFLVNDLQLKLATAETSLREYQVNRPLRQLAEDVSALPDLWQMMFEKHYRLEIREGVLTVLDAKGEPVLVDGKPLPFSPKEVGTFVSKGDSDAAKQFARLTIGTKASGSGADGGKGGGSPVASITSNGKKDEPKSPLSQFGLR